jgi:hypothetical protein
MEKMTTTLFTTLSEAVNWVNENKMEGVICPCCGQIAKVYKRKLHTSMALTLINLYKKNENNDWVDVKDFLRINKLKNSHDWTLLRYWGIIEEKQKGEEKTKTSGLWRITEKGKLFVENRLEVPRHIYIFDTKLLGNSEQVTTIIDALGDKFNYNELFN